MNKSELCAHVAIQARVWRATAESVDSALFTAIGETLARQESLTVSGLGTFSTPARSARQGRDPTTGESISIAASKTPAFKPGENVPRNRQPRKVTFSSAIAAPDVEEAPRGPRRRWRR